MWLIDLKTVPDPVTAKRLLALESFSDSEAVLAMTVLRVAQAQTAVQPTQFRRVVAATLLRVDDRGVEVVEFDDADGEPALLAGVESELRRADGPVWAWDASQHYRSQMLTRALAYSLVMPRLLAERGPLSLASHFGFADGSAGLAELAAVHGLPHALGLRMADAEAAHGAGDRERLRAGSACDALMAHLLTLTLQQATGERSAADVADQRAVIRAWLSAQLAPHWRHFLARWKP